LSLFFKDFTEIFGLGFPGLEPDPVRRQAEGRKSLSETLSPRLGL
jgi:hypothetical protein